ncbi:histidine phosphatase family protein [Gordonia soli]|uniref:Phosphoglycerate mutase family protein n=1 Tax=Gordonia soli NBRC 108243 TaxID=1223545 RepID=M0QM95_9ACTN|nr:histidine phosphatase family protein [Gordonia soli]GAC69703.1 phosphoglycerate mutase family protein [Gordonia soli NBRC 108243]
MRLFLVRHAQIQPNVDLFLESTVPGPDLTEEGRRQADAVVDVFDGRSIDAVYASSMIRTRQTAEPLAAARGLDIHVRDGLREINSGHYEGVSYRADIEGFISTIRSWAERDLDVRMPGGETGAKTIDRFTAVVDEAATGAQDVVLVSHGAIIAVWCCVVAQNVSTASLSEHLAIPNTGVVSLCGDPTDGWRVENWAGQAVDS